jgi:MFS family permease
MANSTQIQLLRESRFMRLFVTQFLGAFNDNLFKNALVVLLTFKAASWTSLKPELLGNLAAGIFILPFFLFSATAGQIVDKLDKSRVARFVKLMEIAIMALAGIGFAVHSLAILLSALFLMGMHSTLFGPVKYAILPQHLQPNELVAGNALIEAGTFTAILFGTLVGGLLAALDDGTMWISIAALFVAIAGYQASRGIPSAPSTVPQLSIHFNPFTDTWRCIADARANREVFIAIIGLSWFWLYGALFLAQFPAYAKNVLGGDELSVTLLLAVFTVGIGTGSLACDRLSHHKVELALVPLGAAGLTLFGLDFALASPSHLLLPAHQPIPLAQLIADINIWRILIDLLLLGAFGGFFCVPLYALMQARSAEERRARTIAANNIMNSLFMVVGALGASALLSAGISIPYLFLWAAIINAVVCLALFIAAPEFFQRFTIRLREMFNRNR